MTVAIVASAALVSGAALVAMAARSDEAPVRSQESAGTRPGPTAAADTTPDEAELRVQALQELLDARSRAVLGGDRAAWLATVDPRSAEFRRRQSTVFGNLRSVPFSAWSYTYAGVAAGPSAGRMRELGGDAWVARVKAGYRLRGYDGADSMTEQFLTLVERDGQAAWLGTPPSGPTGPPPQSTARTSVTVADTMLTPCVP